MPVCLHVCNVIESLVYSAPEVACPVNTIGTGKSCILQALAEEDFQANYVTTIGIDFKIVMENIDGKIVKMQVWDTAAGNQRFESFTKTCCRSANGILVVYDVTNARSFENVQHYMTVIDQYDQHYVGKILIGNRCDLNDDRKVSTERGQAKADEYGMAFSETSAKTNTNIRESFIALAKDILPQSSTK